MPVSTTRGINFTFRHLLPTLLDYQLVEPQFLSRTLQHPLLDTTLGDEPEDEYLFGLTDAVGAVHCLKIGLWIPVHLSGPKPQVKFAHPPVTVIKDDDIGGRQVDTQTSSASGEQEDKFIASFFVVIVNGLNTVLMGSASIDPTVL